MTTRRDFLKITLGSSVLAVLPPEIPPGNPATISVGAAGPNVDAMKLTFYGPDRVAIATRYIPIQEAFNGVEKPLTIEADRAVHITSIELDIPLERLGFGGYKIAELAKGEWLLMEGETITLDFGGKPAVELI